jgi:hypothetical protein
MEDDPQILEEVSAWMIRRLLRLKDVFGWRLAKLLLGEGGQVAMRVESEV